jgi:1,2-diacylglycerol 3-beta-galactosyltransferase
VVRYDAPVPGSARLLFLFSDTGAGHRAAAEAVAAAVERRFPGRYQVDCFDPMADRHVLAGRLTALYGPVTRRLPPLWGLAYRATNWQPTVRLVQHAIGRGLQRKLRRALEPRPALVASFHPLLNHVAADVMPAGVPRVTVITDWIDFHQAWTDLRADCIICPSEAAYTLCRQRGIPADRLVTAGLPIHPRFADAIRQFKDRPAMRLRLRLRPHAPTVLLTGGGDGTEPLRKYAAALARSPLDIQVLAVCGRNHRLAARIRADNHAGVHVFGFVDNMPELLLAADLLGTRAGPGMIAEGLACGCPLLLTGYLPGQEEGNAREVERRGLGRFVPRPDDLVEAVTAWFGKPEAERREEIRRARAAADPAAAFQVAEVLDRLSR